jgi:cellulose synthase/poly-beta-1,6-N-acetylglucosamine synthase-like glycosyltransferase
MNVVQSVFGVHAMTENVPNEDNLRASIILPFAAPHAHCLERCVRSLAAQTIPRSEYEVILVNAEGDSGVDSIAKAIEDDAPKNFNFHYFKISKRGRAAARNHGVKKSRGNVLLLYATDFIATPLLLEQHLTLHEKNSDARVVGIGPSVFHPKLEITPFMRWLEESGALFGTSFSSPDTRTPENFFYGGNTSIKRHFLEEVGSFDERLPYHAVDDFEMGSRLFKRGMKSVYLPRALAYHDHQVSFMERRTAMKEAGESTAILESGDPGMVTHDKYHDACKSHASAISLIASWHRIKYLLFDSEPDLHKYFDLSMTRAWAEGYLHATILNREETWRGALTTLLEVYGRRPDLQKAFPESDTHGFAKLVHWALGAAEGRWEDSDQRTLRKHLHYYQLLATLNIDDDRCNGPEHNLPEHLQ